MQTHVLATANTAHTTNITWCEMVPLIVKPFHFKKKAEWIWCAFAFITLFHSQSAQSFSKRRNNNLKTPNRMEFLAWWRFEFKSVWFRVLVFAYTGGRRMVLRCVACHKYNLIMVCYYCRYYCVDCCLGAPRHVHIHWARFYSLILSL